MNFNLPLISIIAILTDLLVYALRNSSYPVEKLMHEWNALGSLSDVRSLKYLVEQYCLPVSHTDPGVNITNPELPTRTPFYESEYLSTPLHVNMFEQICLISAGQEPSVNPVPLTEYSLIYPAAQICQPTGQPVDILILINSSPRNSVRRKLLRSTLTNGTAWFGARVRHVFLLDGPSDAEPTDAGLTHEVGRYNDIAQIDSDSEYSNDTLKLVFAFRWSLSFCPQAKWLLFVRDDYMVNPYNTIHFLLSISEAMRQRLIAGTVWDDPLQTQVNPLLYPGRNVTVARKTDRYRTFVATSAMLVSSVLAPSLYLTMRFTDYIDQPDLFFAAAMQKLFIVPAHVERFYAYDRRPITEQEKTYAIVYPE